MAGHGHETAGTKLAIGLTASARCGARRGPFFRRAIFDGIGGMNITHVVENLNRGGLERMVIELVKLQQQQGHHCQIVCLFEPGALAHELSALGIAVTACGKQPGLDLGAVRRLRGLIRAHATEVLHTHNAVAHYYAVPAAWGSGVRRVINTRHSMLGARQSSDDGALISHKVDRRERLYQCAVACTDIVATVCDAARRDAVALGIVPASKARVVNNGIRVEAFERASESMRARLRGLLQLSDGARVIGSVGRLTRLKDQAGLIKAFALVHAQQPSAALVFVGDGELRESLPAVAIAEGVAESVHFLGDRSDVRELLQGFDIFALSSLSEGYSMALLEACATALPIVATDVGGNGEIVRHDITGLLVAPCDPAAMAAALTTLLEQPSRAQQLGNAARAWVERDGSLASMASGYNHLYGPVSV
jgi:glycosyltransferase involved in cell wall biosynthesis